VEARGKQQYKTTKAMKVKGELLGGRRVRERREGREGDKKE
jgi:hypothetical protein